MIEHLPNRGATAKRRQGVDTGEHALQKTVDLCGLCGLILGDDLCPNGDTTLLYRDGEARHQAQYRDDLRGDRDPVPAHKLGQPIAC